jgi:hypothetical protein
LESREQRAESGPFHEVLQTRDIDSPVTEVAAICQRKNGKESIKFQVPNHREILNSNNKTDKFLKR